MDYLGQNRCFSVDYVSAEIEGVEDNLHAFLRHFEEKFKNVHE